MAAKKEKFHSEVPQEVYDMLETVVEAHHDDLMDTEFLVLFKHGGWKSRGKTVFGKVQVLNDAFRRTMRKDVIIYLNADMWALLSKPQKNYVIDHQLYTLDLKYDRHDNVLEAPDGRPLLSTVPPDIEAYTDVVKRHGIVMEDVKRLAKAMTEMNQVTLEEVLKFEPNDNAAADFRNIVKEAEQHEGITYTLDGSGNIEVEKDEGGEQLEILSTDEKVDVPFSDPQDPDAPLTFEDTNDNW